MSDETNCPLEPGPGVAVIVRDARKRQTKSGLYKGEENMCTGIVHRTGPPGEDTGDAWWANGDRIMTAGYTEYAMVKHLDVTYEVVPFGNIIAIMREELDSDNYEPVLVQEPTRRIALPRDAYQGDL